MKQQKKAIRLPAFDRPRRALLSEAKRTDHQFAPSPKRENLNAKSVNANRAKDEKTKRRKDEKTKRQKDKKTNRLTSQPPLKPPPKPD